MRKTTNLITGIGGFVASHLADYLLEQGEVVYGTCRWIEDQSRINHLKANPNFHLVPMDLNDLSSCIKAIEEVVPDYIFHLAAQSYVNDSFRYPEETLRTNIIGTYNLLEAVRLLRDSQISQLNSDEGYDWDPVIHVCSSSEVYGIVKSEELPIKESQPFRPANPYGVSKVGEDMLALMYWQNFGIKTIRTRMFTHTGPRRTMMSAESHFAKQIAKIEKGLQEPIVYHGNLNSLRTWADVRDAVKAYYLLVHKCPPGEVYNIGGNTQKTVGEMLDYLISLSSAKDKIIKKMDPVLLRPNDVTLQVPDSSKFMNETGWKPEIPFEKTMEDLLNWWREYVGR